MWKCESCARYLMPGAVVCPFCASSKLATMGMAIVGPLVLSACYGAPPCEGFDDDGDGFDECGSWDTGLGGSVYDCDDDNPDISPAAEEICDDGIDNDCDGVSAATDQLEICNGIDDDCDELVDEDLTCDTGYTTDTSAPPAGRGSILANLTYSADAAIATCAEAGLGALTVTVDTLDGEPVATAELCSDDGVRIDDLAPGDYELAITGNSDDAVRIWASAPTPVFVVAGETLEFTVILVCDSPGVDGGCGP